MFSYMKKQGRMHGYRSRVQVGRGSDNKAGYTATKVVCGRAEPESAIKKKANQTFGQEQSGKNRS